MASGLKIKHTSNIHVFRWFLIGSFLIITLGAAYFGFRWYTTGEEPPFPVPVAAAGPSIDESKVTPEDTAKYRVEPTKPRYISIPALAVETARVMPVSTNSNAILEMPKNSNDAGWYQKSATPGSGTGAVLINGHGRGITNAGLFSKLDTLQAEDEIIIERGDGKEYTYYVVDVRTMPLEQAIKSGMKEMMYSAEVDKEGLSLIADTGKWVPKDQVFDQKLMIRAVLLDI